MKKTRRYLILLSIIVLLSCLPFAHATESIAYQQTAVGYTRIGEVNTGHGYGIEMTGNNQYLTRAIFYVGSHIGYTGNLQAIAVSGSYSTGYLSVVADHESLTPNATSFNTISIAFEGYQWIEFLFDGTLNLTTGNWAIMVQNVDWQSNGLEWQYATAPSTFSAIGDSGGYSGWNGPPATIYTSDEALSASPTPIVTSAPATDATQLYTDFVNFLTPMLVMIVPAMLLWWLGGRGKWPLLIGLAIGTGLGYVFITGFPLWLVFLVAIGIIGMAYSDVSSGNGMT